MPRLDKFIQVMREQKAQALHLSAGKPVALMVSGASRPITRDNLAAPQILGLIKEIAPAGHPGALEGGQTFSYQLGGGEIQVELSTTAEGLAAILRAPTAPSTQPATPASSAAPRTTLRTAVMAEDPGARAAVDRLLRILSESGASDLHLRTGEPPIMRRDGDLVRLEESPVTAAAVQGMLASIMPVKDYTEFSENGDADFA